MQLVTGFVLPYLGLIQTNIVAGRSHRARIPAEINMRVGLLHEDKKQVYRQYRLDMKNGKITSKMLSFGSMAVSWDVG